MEEMNPSNSSCTDEKFIKIPSQRGGTLLLRKGYRYSMKRKNCNGHEIWVCVKRKQCHAKMVISANIIILEEAHNCASDEAENHVKLRLSKCIHDAETDITPITTIYSEVVEEMKDAGPNEIDKIPKFDNIKKRLYKHRNKALQVKKIRFRKVVDVEIPKVFKNFLFAEYIEKNVKLLLFATEEGIKNLSQAKDIFCDGTFKSAVPPFTQLYSIHADLGSTEDHTNIIPTVYALLPNKKQETYEIMFYMIKSRIPSFKPETFTTDFEVCAMKAIQTVFPEATVRGCLFHFTQAVWRKAKRHVLHKSKLSKSHVKRCMALAHLPQQFRSDGWLYIRGECVKKDEKTTNFNNYFENTWLGKGFLQDKWSFNGVMHKTNNAIESWNSRLNRKVKPKPNIVMLLKTLKKDADYYTGLFRKNGYITKRSLEKKLEHRKIEKNVTELMENDICVGYCIERLCNL